MHGPARKHIRAWREVRASRPLHHQPLPWIARAHEQHGRRRSRCDRRTFVDRGGREHLGPIDILVNNFGARAGTSWQDTGPKEFETAFAGNVTVSLRMTQLVLPSMIERGWGRVVVITSVYGREAGGAPAYNAAKAAETSMVKSLAREVASKGVTVNGVAPGSILWEGGGWHRRQQADPEGIAEFVRHEMPLGRFGTVDEVAGVVAFVCSKQASLLNGASIAVDGAQGRSNI